MLNETLMIFSILQEIWQHHRKSLMMSKDSEKRRNWEKWERRTIAINTITLLFSKSKEKSLDDKKSLMSMTYHVLGIWTCTWVAWQFRVVSLGEASAKFPDQTEVQGWIVNCSGSRDRSNQLAEGPHQSRSKSNLAHAAAFVNSHGSKSVRLSGLTPWGHNKHACLTLSLMMSKDSEKRRNWEKWERRTIAINTITLLFSKSKGEKSRRQKSLMSMN